MSERTLEDAMRNSERLRNELPQLVQPTNSDYDMVRLADEVNRLQAKVLELEFLGHRIINARDYCSPRYRCPADLDGAIGELRMAFKHSSGDGRRA
jgi:hypothetical protein